VTLACRWQAPALVSFRGNASGSTVSCGIRIAVPCRWPGRGHRRGHPDRTKSDAAADRPGKGEE
jgi:hypothetical protein